jgi:hypothetical protein
MEKEKILKNIEVYGMLEKAEYLEKNKLLKLKVRYIGTDFNYSKLDIYEDISGKFYCTNL